MCDTTDKPILYGFDGSTYVRTVRMLCAEKGVAYEQVPVNVLKGEPREPEHLARHPFGKVPVLEHAGLRILETNAIVHYIDEVFDGPAFVPASAGDRARMRTAIGMIDAYGYPSLVGRVCAYHLFPELFGGVDGAAREAGIRDGMLLLNHLMEMRGTDAFIAGDSPSFAELYLAPICAYLEETDDSATVFKIAGFASWWERVQALESFARTAP